MRSCKRVAVRRVAVSLLVLACLSHGLPHPATATSIMPAASSVDSRNVAVKPLDASQREVLMRRLAEWETLSPVQRQQRREHYQAWQQLEASERAVLRNAAAEFATFDPERQAALRQEFEALDETLQRGWRLGPVLGADYAQLHPLLAYLPADQRLPMLRALRGLDVEQRTDLAVLAQRTAPQERQQLREKLLAIEPSRRAAWLQQRMRD